MMRAFRWTAVVLAVGIAGCATRGGWQDANDCEPVGAGDGDIDAAALEGDYRLTMVATGGEREGASEEGGLWLRPNPPDRRGIPSAGGGDRTDASAPLYGWTDLDLGAVGAVDLGDPGSRDVEAPGVLAVESRGGVVLRLGAEANRRDVIRFDGGYTVLRVHRATGAGFAGSWSSGTVDVVAEGHFCADRAG